MEDGLPKVKWTRRDTLWAAGYALVCVASVGLVYFWRVFYDFDRIVPWKATWLVWGLATVVYAALYAIARFVKNLDVRTTAIIALTGLLFCAADPPMQAPDEASHYLRTYAVSMGRFDFDAQRRYPADVDLLLSTFTGAWANRMDGAPVKNYYELADPDDPASAHVSTKDDFYSIAGCFSDYFRDYKVIDWANNVSTGTPQGEPVAFSTLPYLVPAAFMAGARAFGFHALGCLYAGRLGNLLLYCALCFLALRGCKRYKPIFIAFMLMPMSLFMGASLNYDAVMLGLYYLAASFYCRDEISGKDVGVFLAVFVLMNAIKPWINLLWIALPLVLPASAWKAKMKKSRVFVLALVLALGATAFVAWYGTAFRFNYGEIGRMIGEVDGKAQLLFIMANPVRYIAVMLGTLYENGFFVAQLGLFGAVDMAVPLINSLSPALLILAASLSTHERSSLSLRPALGLLALALAYIGGLMTAMYITYTPVGMVRIIGLQARYFLPPFLLIVILVAAFLSHRLAPTTSGGRGPVGVMLLIATAFAVLGALLMTQHYYVGPVRQVLKETPAIVEEGTAPSQNADPGDLG